MSDNINILCYSDIHYHNYTDGITLEDVIATEQELINLASNPIVDCIIFAGDRYISRNPLYQVGLASDRMLKQLNDLGKPIVLLIGNHDRTTKNSYSIHSMSHINLYHSDLRHLTVIDTARTQVIPSRHGIPIALHATPADHLIPQFTIDKQIPWNICIFHGMIIGSSFMNGTLAQDGISPHMVDRPEFDLVLGGDNHKHQRLPLTNTIGYYIGAPMQHNWGDVGDPRGFCLITLSQNPTKQVQIQHILSHSPKFLVHHIRINEIEDLIQLIMSKRSEWKDNLVELHLSGTSRGLDGIIPNDWENKIKEETGARVVRIRLEFDIQLVSPPQMMERRTEADEWRDYLTLQGPILAKGLDLEKLNDLGLGYINNAATSIL